MKVYLPLDRDVARKRLYVTPATTANGDVSWAKNPDGSPIMFTVEFQKGEAEVIDELGRYMIDKKLAHRSFLIVPEGAGIRS